MGAQRKAAVSKLSDPISALPVLTEAKNVCDKKSILEGASMWLFQHFILEPYKAALLQRVTIEKKNHQ